MGGFAGLASIIGGAGEAASQYGQQVRGLIEQRREGLTQLMIALGTQDPDPQRRSEYLGYASDLYAGKDISKILPALAKSIQGHVQSNQALSQMIGGPPAPQQPQPGTAQVGQTPGTPQTPPAAQPATSPVQPQAQDNGSPDALRGLIAGPPSQAPAPQTAQGPIAQASAAPTSPVSTDLGLPAELRPPSSADIYAKYHAIPEFNTPAGFARLKPLLDQDIAHADALWQQQTQLQTQMGLGPQRMAMLSSPQAQQFADTFRHQGIPEFMIPSIVGRMFGIDIPAPAGMGVMSRPVMVSPMMEGSQAPPGTTIIGTNQPPKPGEYYRLEYRSIDGAMIATPTQAPTTLTQGPEGQQVTNTKTGQRVAGVENTAPQGSIHPLEITLGDGSKVFQSPWQAQHGVQPFGSAGVNTAMMPQVRTTSTPGEAPTTSITRRGGAGGSAALTPGPAAVDPLVKREYDDWASGKGPAPTGKKLAAVQSYAEQNGLQTPVQLTAAGQKAITAVDDVMGQIKNLKALVKQKGLDKDNPKLNELPAYYTDYLRYAHGGQKGPDSELFTGLSFEALRSAAAAMQGSNSRAYQVITRALQHTPNLEMDPKSLRKPDGGALIYSKLGEMQSILENGRQKIFDDERKSGVVQPMSNPTDSGVKPVTITTRSGKTITIQ